MMLLQVLLGGVNQTPLLVAIYARRRAAKGSAGTHPHFHKDQRLARRALIQHHQVQLAIAIAHVAGNVLQSRAQQMVQGHGFTLRAACLARRCHVWSMHLRVARCCVSGFVG